MSRARRFALASAVASALVLTGCATGQIAETAQEQATLDGVHGRIGDVTLVAYLRAPFGSPCYLPGASVPLSLMVVNTARQPDTLVSISSPRFAGMTVAASGDDASKVITAESGTGTCGGTAAPVTAAPTAPGSLPQATTLPTVEANTKVDLGISTVDGATDLGSNPVVLLQGLKGGPLYPGNSVQVTLSFEKAGTLTLAVPVQLSVVAPNASISAPASGGA